MQSSKEQQRVNNAKKKKKKKKKRMEYERSEIIKIRAEINAKETKETIAKINKAKSWFFEKINKNHQPDSSRNKGRRIKSTKLEIKMEKSQQTTLKYKGS